MARQREQPLRLTRRDLINEMAALADPERAKSSAWFFKTGKGQYGEGDQFLGIRVPEQRKLARRYAGLRLTEISRLLRSSVHEHRFTAAEILVEQYEQAGEEQREKIYRFYLSNAPRLKNWDLVDTSAPYIVGEHLLSRERSILGMLARSDNLWERRIAIVATLRFAKAGETDDVFRTAALLLNDNHDLIHKAIGWALREAGRISRAQLLNFLRQNYYALPRTSLRYAIEHLPERQRKQVLAGDFR